MEDKLIEILNYYKDTWKVDCDISDVLCELLENNVEVSGNSFYCEIKIDSGIVLLAGTKEKADLWVLKKILKLISTNQTIYTVINGNSEYLLDRLSRYNYTVTVRDGDTSFLIFNKKDI